MPLKDKKAMRQYQLAWHHRRRRAFFADKHCAFCGSTEKLILHHLNPAEKKASVIWSWSAENQQKEIDKCIILCGHCHQKLHNPQKPLVHGTRNAYVNKGCRCDECRAWNAQRVKLQRQRSATPYDPDRPSRRVQL